MIARHLTSTKSARALLSLAVLALLALTLRTLAFSDASFTAGGSSPATVLTAGSLSHTNSRDGQVVLNAIALMPGGPAQSGTLTITGAGDQAAAYTLSRVSLTDTPATPALSAVLTLRVEDVTGAPIVLYTGTPAVFPVTPLGAIAPGAARTYRFSLWFPVQNATSSSLQGATMALRLQVTGVTP